MFINFRQGIVRHQESPSFLSLSGGNVNLNASTDPTIITFAHGNSDYLFTENVSISAAWAGPFIIGSDYWLYWDIDTITGLRSFGYTDVDPFSPANGYGSTLPSSPSTNQHFFLTTERKMKVYSGGRWSDVIRVFAGKLANGAILEPFTVGSQIGSTQQLNVGAILFDDAGNAVKRFDRFGRGEFLTTESNLNAQSNELNNFKLETLQVDGKAIEPLPKYHAVSWKGPKQLGIASYSSPNYPCVGIAIEDIVANEVGKFITHGFVTNTDSWNWSEAPNTPIWVGLSGEITTSVPQTISLQRVGHIVSPDTVFIEISEIMLLEPVPVSVTPTVTPTPTPTPTGTPTPTVTPTVSVTPTETVTPTPTVTPTITPTETVTPTPTVTVTPSETPAVSVTPTPTVTPTPSTSPSYEDIILGDSPTHYWRMNELVGGTTVNDEVGTNDLTVASSTIPATISGVLGLAGAAVISHDDDYSETRGFELTDPIVVTTTTAYSVEAWVYGKTTTWTEWYGTILGGPASAGFEFNADPGTPGEITIYFSGSISGEQDTMPSDQWNHLVYVCHGDNTATVYLNGASLFTVANLGTTAGNISYEYVGNDGAFEDLDGYLDEVAYYNYELTAGDVLAHYNAGNGLFEE